MRGDDGLDFLLSVLEVQVVQVAVRLETPSDGTDEFVVVALLFHVLDEYVHPYFQQFGAHVEILNTIKTSFWLSFYRA